MDPFKLRKLGRTDVMLPQLGFGGAPLGDLFDKVSDEQSDATMAAAWGAGIRYYDTSPWYGRTQSEHRLGRFLRRQNPDEVVLSTKVGRIFRAPVDPAAYVLKRRTLGWAGGLNFEHHYDYSYDGIMRSYEDSLQRLGMTRIDLLIIHDLDRANHQSEVQVAAYLTQLATGGFRALTDLKAWGCIKAIGCGVNDLGTIGRFVELFDLDFFLVALRYTLGEQRTLDDEIPLLVQRNIGVIIGGVYSSGIYATGPVPGARYNYHDPTPKEAERARRIAAVCNRHGVTLAAAALQFPLHHPLVASVIPGAFEPQQAAANVTAMRETIPDQLWTELKHDGLLRADAPTP
jgi:D-threo-aldose 1-dehydrogenase